MSSIDPRQAAFRAAEEAQRRAAEEARRRAAERARQEARARELAQKLSSALESRQGPATREIARVLKDAESLGPEARARFLEEASPRADRASGPRTAAEAAAALQARVAESFPEASDARQKLGAALLELRGEDLRGRKRESLESVVSETISRLGIAAKVARAERVATPSSGDRLERAPDVSLFGGGPRPAGMVTGGSSPEPKGEMRPPGGVAPRAEDSRRDLRRDEPAPPVSRPGPAPLSPPSARMRPAGPETVRTAPASRPVVRQPEGRTPGPDTVRARAAEVALDREDLAAALGMGRGRVMERAPTSVSSEVAAGEASRAEASLPDSVRLERAEVGEGAGKGFFTRLRQSLVLTPSMAEAVVAPGMRAVGGSLALAVKSLGRAQPAIADGSQENVRVQYGLEQAGGLFEKIAAHLKKAEGLVVGEMTPTRVGVLRQVATAARGELHQVQLDAGEARAELGDIAGWAKRVGVKGALREVAELTRAVRRGEGELRLLGGRAAVLESLDPGAVSEGQFQKQEGTVGIPPHRRGKEGAPPDLEAARPPGIPADFTFGEEDLARIGTGLDPSQPPPQNYWNEELVNSLCDLGRQRGGVTDAEGHAHLLLARQLLEGAEGQSVELGAAEIAVALKAAGIPLEKVDPNQLHSAARYVNTATHAADQHEKLRKTLDNFQVLTTIGTPPLSRQQMVEQLWAIAKVPGHALEKLSGTELQGKYQEIVAATNAGPGQHELKVGKHNLKFTVGESGQVTQSETKKPGFFSKVGGFFKKIAPIALTVASFIPFTAPFARIAQGAISLVKAIRSKSLLGAVTAAAGAVAGGATAIASRVASGAAGTAATVARIANGAARGLQGVSSIRQGSLLGGIAALGSGVASAIGQVAEGASTGLQKFANRLGDTSAKLSYAARGMGIVDGYRAASAAVNEAKVALREAEASGDPAAIAAARQQLAAAEKAKKSALLGGAASAAGLAADVRADHTIFPGEARDSPIPQTGLDQALRGASRGLSVAQGVQSGDYASAGVNALGLAAVGGAALGAESAEKMGLTDAANMADAGLAYHQTNAALTATDEVVAGAEAALQAALGSGDAAAIQQAQAHLDQARKGREGALMGAIAAGDSLVLTAAQIGQKFHDSRQVQRIEGPTTTEDQAALEKEQERAVATWKEADEQEQAWLAQANDEGLSPQEREAAAAGILALRRAKEAYDTAIEGSAGDPEKLYAATVAFEELQTQIETEVTNRASTPAYAALGGSSPAMEASPIQIGVTVERGMTVWEISQRTGVPVDRILEFNAQQGHALDPRKLRVGQEILVPIGEGEIQFTPKTAEEVRAMQRAAIATQQAAAARAAGVPNLTPQDAKLLSEASARFESEGLAAGVETLTRIIDTGSPAAREEARRWLGEIEKEHLSVVQHQNTQNMQALTQAAVDATSTSWFDLNPVATFMRWAGHEENVRTIADEKQASILIQINGISVANGVRATTGLTLYELERMSTDQIDATLRTAYPDVDPARLAHMRTQLTSALVNPDVAALSQGSYQTGTFTWETGQGQVDTSFADGIAMTLGKVAGETVRDAREYAELMRTEGSWWERPLGSFSANTLDAVSSVNRFALDSIQTAQEFYGQQGGVLGKVGGGLTFAGSALSMLVTSPLTLADYRATDQERSRAVVDVGLMLATAGLVKAGAPAFSQIGAAASRGVTRLAATRLGQAATPLVAGLGRAGATGVRLGRTPVDDIFRGAGNLALRQGTRAADALGANALGRLVQGANQRVLSPLAQYSSRAGGFFNRAADAGKDYFRLVNNFGRGPVLETGARVLARTGRAELQATHAAAKEYDLIRRATDDVAEIARNTGRTEAQIARIKNHIFNKLQNTSTGLRRFDPDFQIAHAWKRLQAGTHTQADLAFMRHELFESRFQGLFRTNYATAHGAAERAAERAAARSAGIAEWPNVGRLASTQSASAGSAAGISGTRSVNAVYLRNRRLPLGDQPWIKYQQHVSQRPFEEVWSLRAGEIGVDARRAGFTVEAKWAGRNNAAWRSSPYNPRSKYYNEKGILDQARDLISLNKALGGKGVSYAVSNPAAQLHFEALFARHFPGEAIRVWHVPGTGMK